MGGPGIVENKAYEEFDNFFICYFYEIEDDKKVEYASTEHYYQSHKMLDPKSRETTRMARTSNEAFLFGNMFPLRKGWDEMKVETMFIANKLKFEQNADLRKLLLNTKGEIEFPGSDSFWGTSIDRSGKTPSPCKGKNMNGLILTTLRAYFGEDFDTYSRYCIQLGLKPEKYL
jgi:ribA/ribD-fused uncharacterized protein